MSDAEILTLAAPDGYPLACRRYLPPEGRPPVGLVIYLHGIQSHGGWYEASCRHLARAGLAVYFADRRGSGLNHTRRGHADSWEQLVDDVVAVEERAIADALPTAGRLPLFLLAVSWGGKLAAAMAAMHDSRYAGVALLCPGICPKRDVDWRTKLHRHGDGWRHNEKLFPIPLADPNLFTASPQWLDFLRRDDLTLHEATARLMFESRRLDRAVNQMAPWIHVPTYLALAERDEIIDNEATLDWFRRVASSDQTLRKYPGMHHTLEFEPQPQPVFDHLAAWLLAHCRS